MDARVSTPLVVYLDDEQRAKFAADHGLPVDTRQREVVELVQAEALAAVQAKFGTAATVTAGRR